MAEINEKIGMKIKRYRMSSKMTQAEFAERLGVTGAAVSAYENGIRQPSFDVLVKIANILGTTTDALLGRVSHDEKTINVSQLTEGQIHTIENLVTTFMQYNDMNRIISESKRSTGS